MQAEYQAGPRTLADGALAIGRAGKTGEVAVGDAHARHFEAVSRGNVFIGANLAGTPVTTQAGLSGSSPALTLYNPAGSGKYGVLLEVTIALTAPPAAACYAMLAINLASAAAPSSTTAATLQNALTSSALLPGLQAYRAATLATAPFAIRYANMALAASSITPGQVFGEIAGSIIVGPGVALSLQTQSAASVVASFTWEEVTIS